MGPRRRVGVVFGGASVEHEVSVVSARGVRAGLESGPFECVPIGVTEDGRWLAPDASAAVLDDGLARVEAADGAVGLEIEPGRGIASSGDGGTRTSLDVDVVFPLIHGWGGEDGRIQGLLELAGVPYVGSGVLGSAVGMDKQVAKVLMEHHGIPMGPWRSFRGAEYRRDPDKTLEAVVTALGLPAFVKPANGGSSVGITRADSPESLSRAVSIALECDDKIVVEAAIDAREIECAVLGNDDPEASVCGEIVPSREFYDYAAKYEDGTSELRIPAPIPAEVEREVRGWAVTAFRHLDLAGLARVDFFVERGTDRILLNEVNTLPGFTPISMFPKLWEASGLTYPGLLERLVTLGFESAQRRRGRATRRGR